MTEKIRKAVVLAAGGLTAHHFLSRPKHKEPDITKAPIPISLEICPALKADTAEKAASLKAGLRQQDVSEAALFGRNYPARVLRSEEQYESEDGLTLPAVRWTEYLDESGKVLYTFVIEKTQQAVYNADGRVVYSSDTYKPKASYDTDPVHWYYSGGQVACAELCFADGENNGSAYYDTNGDLLAVWSQYAHVDKDGKLQIEDMYFDNAFVMIEKDAFLQRIPQTDADVFMQFNWD